MAITDLTGYTWHGNETIDISTVQNYSINFISNDIEFDELLIRHQTSSIMGWDLKYHKTEDGYISVYAGTVGWNSESYRTIQIISGDDATNPTLISWLEANGTLIAPEPPTPSSYTTTITYDDQIIFDGEIATPYDIVYDGNIIASVPTTPSLIFKCAETVTKTDVLIGNITLVRQNKKFKTDVRIDAREKEDEWEYPQPFEDDGLIITQTYAAMQVGNALYLDGEAVYYNVTTSGSNCTITGSGSYLEGTECTILCIPSSGYNFTSWNINGTTITTNPYTFTVNADTTVVATVTAQPSKSYTLTLSGISGATHGWEKVSTPANPNSTLYDGVYASLGKGTNNARAYMKITFSGYTTFNIYIRSYAESNYDYTIASKVDAATVPTEYSSTTTQAHTRGNQQSGTAIGSYTKVSYTGLTTGQHFIYVVYRKDSSVNSNDDRGYVLIEK